MPPGPWICCGGRGPHQGGERACQGSGPSQAFSEVVASVLRAGWLLVFKSLMAHLLKPMRCFCKSEPLARHTLHPICRAGPGTCACKQRPCARDPLSSAAGSEPSLTPSSHRCL